MKKGESGARKGVDRGEEGQGRGEWTASGCDLAKKEIYKKGATTACVRQTERLGAELG